MLEISTLERAPVEYARAHWYGETEAGRSVYVRFEQQLLYVAFGPTRDVAVMECLHQLEYLLDTRESVLVFRVPREMSIGPYLLLEGVRRVTSGTIAWPPDEEVPGELEMRAFLGEE